MQRNTSNEVCGGGPQGGLLTSILFILQVNKAGSPCTIPALGQNGRNQPAFVPVPPSLGQNIGSQPVVDPIFGPFEHPVVEEESSMLPVCHDKGKLDK